MAGTVLNPFYPLPYRGRALAADLAIPDYRKKPLTKDNLFAIVEIKFEGDRIEHKQFKKYKNLSDECGKVKTAVVGKARTRDGEGVTLGCRVSLFRFPEDSAVEKKEKPSEDKRTAPEPSDKPGRSGNRKRK